MFQILQIDAEKIVFNNPEPEKVSAEFFRYVMSLFERHSVSAREYQGDNRNNTFTVFFSEEIDEDKAEAIWEDNLVEANEQQ